jgi:hypothetical protein
MVVEQDRTSKSNDRTGILFTAALVIVLLSFGIDILSVHTYCENRPVAGLVALASGVVGYLAARNRPSGTFRRVLSISGGILCLFMIAANLWFILWATRTCRHMFDLLDKPK